MTLEEAQKEVDKWIKTYGVRYFSELTNMAVLTEEGGALARVMARVDVTKAFRKSLEKKTKRDNKRHINNPKLNDHGRE